MMLIRPPVASAVRFPWRFGPAHQLQDHVERTPVRVEPLRMDGLSARPRATAARSFGLRTVATTLCAAIRPSCTAAVPTPTARAVHEQPVAHGQTRTG